MGKKKVTQFEYAIASQISDKEYLDKLEAFTDDEELQQRIDKLKNISSKLIIKNEEI